jgi:uncharacterized protein YciW
MLAWALKLTRTPWAMRRDDAEGLRAVGLGDGEILALCEVTAYYAYVNRIADGLGVDVEPWVGSDPPAGAAHGFDRG